MKVSRICLMLICLTSLIIFYPGCSRKERDAEVFFEDGRELFQQKKYSEAIEKYEKGLSKEPNNAVGYNLLGMAYRFRFNETGAQEYKEKEIAAFKKAVDLDPKYWVAYKNLAASLYYQGRKKEAVPYIEKALELQPNDPEKELLHKWIKEAQKE
ncbi:MAG: tetratricopeptide repeat protein [Candidatus Cloacimonetes bacterium]|nr:tetratricopeptide repeat protein [Candidatus Cloacimonadota bacterium]